MVNLPETTKEIFLLGNLSIGQMITVCKYNEGSTTVTSK